MDRIIKGHGLWYIVEDQSKAKGEGSVDDDLLEEEDRELNVVHHNENPLKDLGVDVDVSTAENCWGYNKCCTLE